MQKTSSRLLALLSLLQVRRGWSGADLAARLEVTERTVRRDVDRLRDLGYPVVAFKGPAGGYRLDAGADLPPLLFDDDQAIALAVALQTVTVGGAVAHDAARALSTLQQVMPSRLRQRIEMLCVTAVHPPESRDTAPVDTQVLVDVGAAVHAHAELRFDYAVDRVAADRPAADRPCADDRPRRVQPHHLVTWYGRWYLLAWDLDRADWRTFRVDRIHPRTPTGPRFTPRALPGGTVSEFVTSRFRGSDGTSTEWPCTGEVVLDLPAPAVAGFARDGIVEALAPGRCRLVLGSWSWTGLAAAIGRFDADIEVIGPPELTSAFAHLAERYAKAVGNSVGNSGSRTAGSRMPNLPINKGR
ncbi:helix-turn-helix transcriptional regulator [Streptomyces flavofungini]|uniref:WYL domain-containing protein n=1 Tax=Streptomyces flavofungini TaxID=68200 RepID=A0ABS0X756_9ACTN|nr:WYL domain-containing protein [Streptomyces flavofungini]MBJ3808998.1 WYL domain-containing protein [Streptomyces flavofungini]